MSQVSNFRTSKPLAMVLCAGSLINITISASSVGRDFILADVSPPPLLSVHSLGEVENLTGVQQQSLPPSVGFLDWLASALQSMYDVNYIMGPPQVTFSFSELTLPVIIFDVVTLASSF